MQAVLFLCSGINYVLKDFASPKFCLHYAILYKNRNAVVIFI